MVQTDPSPAPRSSYEEDLVGWSLEQARLLEERRFDELDLVNLVEEVSSMGGSDKREIDSRLEVLLLHLLKWRYQPGRRTPSWQSTIRHQRSRIGRLVAQRPSLKRYPADAFEDAYAGARLAAAFETGIDFTLFPERAPFPLESALDPDYLPKHPDFDDQAP